MESFINELSCEIIISHIAAEKSRMEFFSIPIAGEIFRCHRDPISPHARAAASEQEFCGFQGISIFRQSGSKDNPGT